MSPAEQKLPLWRLISGGLVLGGMAAVLLALAPTYLDDFRLQRFMGELAHRPDAATTPDRTLLATVLDKAHQLDLPVEAGDVHITHPDGKLNLQMKYSVHFRLYQVDLHFHPNATSR